MRRLTLILLILLFASSADAEDLASSSFRKNNWLVEIWTGGGTGLSGTTKGTNVWLTGGRVGKLLTKSFEYDFESSTGISGLPG